MFNLGLYVNFFYFQLFFFKFIFVIFILLMIHPCHCFDHKWWKVIPKLSIRLILNIYTHFLAVGKQLIGKAFYNIDGKIYCEQDYMVCITPLWFTHVRTMSY